VPALEQDGGVAAVAGFVCDTLERSEIFDISIVSLAVSARDDLGVALTRPASWFRGVTAVDALWQGRRYIRIGAFGSELEFQRYQPRSTLTTALSGCDLLQVVCGSPAYALAVCGFGRPVAVHCASRATVERHTRQMVERGMLSLWRRFMTTVTDHMERKALRSVQAIQVYNARMFDYARQVNADRRVVLRHVPPGVDSHRYTPLAVKRCRAESYVLCVARLDDERKNLDLLLRAFAEIPRPIRDSTWLLLAGATSPPDTLWLRAQQLGIYDRIHVVTSPTTSTLIELYQNAAVFALTSNEEGFGMVIIEAMACGVPVVSTRSGGPEEIITDGYNGYLVALNDAYAFADRLTKLLACDELIAQMGRAARDTVLTRYDTSIAGRALLSTYEILLANCKDESGTTNPCG